MSKPGKHSFSDYDTRLKPAHLAAGPNLFTVKLVGQIRTPTRDRVEVIAGDEDDTPPEFNNTLVLYFREVPLKPFTLNTTNRKALVKAVGDDPAAVKGCVLTLTRKTLKQFGGQETIEITGVRKPGQPASTAEAQANEAIRQRKLADLRTLRKEEEALLKEIGQDQDKWLPEQVRGWSVDVIDEQAEQIKASIAFLTEKIAARKERKDLEARLINLRMEADKLGYPAKMLPKFDEVTNEEVQAAIDETAEWISGAGQLKGAI
ncbi:MAG: hypothetical protein WCF84_09285 [Anaerolineae bacterium]